MKLVKFLAGVVFLSSPSFATEAKQIDSSDDLSDNLSDNDFQNEDSGDDVYEYFEAELGDQATSDYGRLAQATTNDKTASDAATSSAPSASPSDAGAKPAGDATKKKVTGKTKKKKGDSSAAIAGGAVEGVMTGHGEQESGLPYKANVDLSFAYNSNSKTIKFKDNSFKRSESGLSFDIKYLFVLGKMEVGPLIKYANGKITSEAADETSGEKSTTTVTSSTLGFGGAFVFNLGNIHQAKSVPYVGADVSRLSTVDTTKNDSGSEQKTTNAETDIGLEGGLKYFMGGHIALKSYLNYTLIMGGESKSEITGSEATVASVTGSKLSIGAGLAKYF